MTLTATPTPTPAPTPTASPVATPAPTPAATPAPTWWYHDCVQEGGLAQWNGINLKTGQFERPVEPEQCTDFVWNDGEHLFNIPESEVLDLIEYDLAGLCTQDPLGKL